MMDTNTESPTGVPVQRLVRRCNCEYQKQKAWGYNLQKWVGGRKSWKEVGNSTHPEDVEKYAQRFETVLIRCNGCGADIVREYPPNSVVSTNSVDVLTPETARKDKPTK